jgi:hypothetical protein
VTGLERRRMNRARLLGDVVRTRRRVAELELRAVGPWRLAEVARWTERFETMSKRLALLDAIARGDK